MKLTPQQLAALATAAGIGAPAAQAGGLTPDGDRIVATLRVQLAAAQADAKEAHESLRIGSERMVAESRMQADRLERAVATRDAAAAALGGVRMERDAARADLARMTADRDAVLSDKAGMKAERDALERTVGRMRSRGASLVDAAVMAGEAADGSHPDVPRVTERLVEPTPVPGRDSRTLTLRFTGAQGTGTADRIKACGGRWTWDRTKPGELASKTGHWTLPVTQAARALCAALRDEGRSIVVEG